MILAISCIKMILFHEKRSKTSPNVQLQQCLTKLFVSSLHRLSKTEAELVLAEQRSRDLSDLLEVSRNENTSLVAMHQKEMQTQLGVNIAILTTCLKVLRNFDKIRIYSVVLYMELLKQIKFA